MCLVARLLGAPFLDRLLEAWSLMGDLECFLLTGLAAARRIVVAAALAARLVTILCIEYQRLCGASGGAYVV